MRVAILAALVVALLVCCGFAFLLVMEKRESSVTDATSIFKSSEYVFRLYTVGIALRDASVSPAEQLRPRMYHLE
jgi:hypothetical protein